jgi:hypothetical protein
VTAEAHQHLSVSLNGVDNVGKTTQLAWLHRGMPDAHLVGTVDAWDSRWREVAAGTGPQPLRHSGIDPVRGSGKHRRRDYHP